MTLPGDNGASASKPEGDSSREPFSAALLNELQTELAPEDFLALAEMFNSEAPELLGELRTSIEAGELGVARKLAHKLKGSCSTLGADEMARLCGQMQKLDLDVEIEIWHQMLRELEHNLEIMRSELEHRMEDVRRR